MKQLIEKLENLTGKKVKLIEKTDYKSIAKPQALIDKCKKADCIKSLNGISLAKTKSGKFFVHTQRARSKYYNKPEEISIEDIKFIETTG